MKLLRFIDTLLRSAAPTIETNDNFSGYNIGAEVRPGTVVFSIPLKARERSRDWGGVIARLSDTVESIRGNRRGYHIVIAAHEIPPIKLGSDITVLLTAARLPADKGEGRSDKNRKRRLIGLWLATRITSGIRLMFVDADDLVSKTLVDRLRTAQEGAVLLTAGYTWFVDAGILESVPSGQFDKMCGSTLAISADADALPKHIEDKAALTSRFTRHAKVEEIAASIGLPVTSIHDPQMVYVVNHEDSLQLEFNGPRPVRFGVVDPAEASRLLDREFSVNHRHQRLRSAARRIGTHP